MNRGAWERLERYVRQLTKDFADVTVVSGPLFLPTMDAAGNWIVRHQVLGGPLVGSAVPTHFYKAVLARGPKEAGAGSVMACFVLPNASIPLEDEIKAGASTGGEPNSRQPLALPPDLSLFVACPTAVERAAGLILFPGYTARATTKRFADVAAKRVSSSARVRARSRAIARGWTEQDAKSLEAWLPPPALLYGVSDSHGDSLARSATSGGPAGLATNSGLSPELAARLQSVKEYREQADRQLAMLASEAQFDAEMQGIAVQEEDDPIAVALQHWRRASAPSVGLTHMCERRTCRMPRPAPWSRDALRQAIKSSAKGGYPMPALVAPGALPGRVGSGLRASPGMLGHGGELSVPSLERRKAKAAGAS